MSHDIDNERQERLAFVVQAPIKNARRPPQVGRSSAAHGLIGARRGIAKLPGRLTTLAKSAKQERPQLRQYGQAGPGDQTKYSHNNCCSQPGPRTL